MVTVARWAELLKLTVYEKSENAEDYSSRRHLPRCAGLQQS